MIFRISLLQVNYHPLKELAFSGVSLFEPFISALKDGAFWVVPCKINTKLQIIEIFVDYDSDGVPDDRDLFPTNPTEWQDFDHDLIGDIADPDDDNDGFPDMIDAFPLNQFEWFDTDGDGIGDNTDDNIDGDWAVNIIDLFPYDPDEQNDTDMDGIGDNSDPDIDDDGYINIQDVFPFDKFDWADFDGDGKGDNTDEDIDNDTYLNPVDAFDFDASEWNDTDGDGDGDNHDLDIDNDLYLNIFDEFPFLSTEWNDTDDDEIGDNIDDDIDGDNITNADDYYPFDPDRYEEKEDFLGNSWSLTDYNRWVFRLFYSTIFLSAYSFLSTSFLYITKRGIFLSGLFVFQRSRKVPHYKKEIRNTNSIPRLEHIFDRVEDDRAHHSISKDQYSLIKEEAERRRVTLTYSVLSSLTADQQMKIFNDVFMKDEKMRAQLRKAVAESDGGGKADAAGDKEIEEKEGDEEIGELADVDAEKPEEVEKTTKAAGVIAPADGKTTDVSGKNVDNVHFTVTAPPRVKPKSSFVVDLWAHLEEQQKKVIEQARLMADEKEDITIRSVGPKPIARGTILTAKLRIEDMEIEDAVQTILWEGEIGNANYAAKVPEGTDLGTKQGNASIHIDGLRIATIHFLIHVVDPSEKGAEEVPVAQIPVQEHRIETAFASYARKDMDEVLPRIQGIQKALPSLNIFLDILSLRSGQNWEQEIRKIIPIRDIFYLFWSENAKNSHWVEVEWRCALETRGIDFIDPVPMVSPEIVPPPPELGKKHFDDWTLAFARNEKLNKPDQ